MRPLVVRGRQLVVVEAVVVGSRSRLRRSTIRAITSEIRNSTTIGTARISIVNGSVDGVATAANTNVPKMIQGRYSPSWLARHDAGEVEQDHEQRDLEGDAEDQQACG